MEFALIDQLIIAFFLLFTIGIGWYSRKTASEGIEGFFLGGKNLPWYLAGISMVATTFAADTPLAVTEMVAKNGIAGNWLWWNMLFGGMFTAIFYAKLWRRSGVVTEAEFITLRYSGKQAIWLKKFKAVYLGVFMNSIILAWVNLAMISILQIFFDLDYRQALAYTAMIMLLVAVYTAVSGLLGVVLTDALQFFVALAGCIILAVIVLNSDRVNGIAGLKESLPEGSLNFFPSIGDSGGSNTLSMSLASFLAFAGMVWWASWYPGNEPGGGGYVAQRMLSTRNEKHSLFATLFFQFAHYGLRPWPWILVGLASVVLYPELGADDKKLGYVLAMKEFLPPGLKGLMLAAFFGAYMSTVSTHLNWGASYLVNDLLNGKKLSRNQVVKTSRLITFGILLLAMCTTLMVTTITGVWEFILQCGAGLGILLILRWFWFRINAWAEIAATITPFIVYAILKLILVNRFPELGMDISENPISFIITTSVTILVWLLVALNSKPDTDEHIAAFTDKVFPEGHRTHLKRMGPLFLAWLGGLCIVYSFLFSIGKLILLEYRESLYFLISLIIGALLFYFSAKKARLF